MFKKSKLFSVFLSTVTVFYISVSSTITSVFATSSTSKFIDMHEISSYCVETREEITDSYGNSYSSNIVAFDARKRGYVRYELKGNYSKFTGNLVASNSTSSDAKLMMSIFADGNEVYTISGFTKQMDAQSIDIDLTGVNVLEFKSRDAKDAYDSWFYVTDGIFTTAESPSLSYAEWDTLADVVLVDSGYYSSYDTMCKDVYGELYFDGLDFDARKSGYALYNLNKGYEKLSGYIWPANNASDKANINVRIFTDNNEVFSKSGINSTAQAIPFEIDVKNIKTLKIETDVADSGVYDQNVLIANTQLFKHQHIPGDPIVTKEATCTETGTKEIHCKECDEVINSESIPANGHKPESKWTITKEPTCTEQGEQVKKCTVCGDPAETEKVEATGHSPSGKWEYYEEGKCKKVQFCTVCGDVALEQKDNEIEQTPSDEWVVTKEATCDHEGERVQYCKICGDPMNTEVIPQTEHDYGKWETKSGSIWNNPIVKERTCSICGDIEHSESSPTSWLKPLIVVLLIIIIGGFAVILVTLKMNGLPLERASIKKLFSKEALSDTDIEKLINKPDNKNRKN